MSIGNYWMLKPAMAVILAAFSAAGVSAQDSTRPLSMEAAVSAALLNNTSIRQAALDEHIAAANYKQTEAIYLPQLGFSYTAFSANNPLNAFGFKLQQKSISQNDFNPDLLNHPSSTPDFTTKLELQQPIINTDMLYRRKAAAKQIDLYRYKTQRTKEYLLYEVQKAWLQLKLAYDAAAVLEDALQTTKAVDTFTENHFKQGLIQKSDLLNAALQVTTVASNLAKANSQVRNASDYLSMLMGAKDGIVYTVNNGTVMPAAAPDTGARINVSRTDFLAMQKAIEASDLMITAAKKTWLPRLNAFGSYQLNDSRMLGFGAHAYLAGVQLSWDIFKGNTAKNNIAAQTLQRNKLAEQLAQQKEQAQMELNKAFRDLADARFEIQQQTQAVEQASEALLILQNRYRQGLVNTTDVLLAGTRLAQQKFALAQASFSAGSTKALIELLTASNNTQ